MRTGVLISGLLLLIFANLLAMWGLRNEGFSNYLNTTGNVSAGPMGPYDQVRVMKKGPFSSYRVNRPNEPLNKNYPAFKLGPDNLFMFRDNKVSPACCGASYSSDTGCVCTTPAQRKFLNTRGGNRTVEDGF